MIMLDHAKSSRFLHDFRFVDWALFSKVLFSLAVLISVGTIITVKVDSDSQISQFKNREKSRIAYRGDLLANRINDIVSDLKLVAGSPDLRRFLEYGRSDSLSDFANDLEAFIESKNIYDQARYLDETGMERVRVDLVAGKAKIIPSDKLQNKGTRYYFTDTQKLGNGEVFISPFDLNIEGTQIEVPFKPMIRLATPLFDSRGARRGIAIINYLGNDLLKRLDSTEAPGSPMVELLNREGFWLKSTNPNDEWNFMFNRPDNFATRNPDVWRLIRESPAGQVVAGGQMWTWSRIHPLRSGLSSSTGSPLASGVSQAPLSSTEYYWIAFSHIPSDLLGSTNPRILVHYGFLWMASLLAAALGSLMIAMRQGRLNQANTELERSIRQVAEAFEARQQAIAELQESDAKLRIIADYTYDWEYWQSPDGRLLYMSPSCERITGYGDDEFIADPELLRRIVHPDDRHLYGDHFHSLENKDYCELEFRIIDKKGDIRWIAHGCRSIYNQEGQYLGRRASNRDLTSAKNVELEYRTILQTAQDGFVIVAADGRFIDTNDAYCRMLGYHRDELLGLKVADIEAAEDQETVLRRIDEIRRTGHTSFETRHRRKDGQTIDVEINASRLDIKGGVLITFIRDITERKKAEYQISQLAFYDTLTDLPNRRLLMERFAYALSQARRHHRSLAVMFLDLDKFKNVNDTLGHDVGDELLRQVAKRLLGCIRHSDTVSRSGGDEFVVLLAEISQADDAAMVAEKIIASINESFSIHGTAIQITTSIGIALYPIDGTDDIQALMKKADTAMYQAKEAGRNCYRYFQSREQD